MVKHRKLFSNNSTLSCPDICNSTCPYGCDPYTDVYTEPNLSAKQHKQISPSVIIVVILLASCILLVSCYFIVVKYFYERIRFRPWQRQQESSEAEFLDENHGPTIDHPIWYINTIGLQPSVIDSITIIRYKKSDNLIEGTECAVCLNEFQNDDSLRLLPKCSHAFHITCIDTWLRSHTNCPVCRAGIISTTAPAVSNSLNSNNMVVDEDSREENLVNDEELNANQVRDNVFLQNRADTGESIEFPQVLDDGPGFDIAKMSIISKGNTASWGIDDLNNKFMMEGENYRVQSMRRSVSVDSILAENISGAVLNLCLAEREDVSVDENTNADPASLNIVENSRTSRILNGGSAIAQFLHKRPIKMKRSFSYAGRSFLSRQNSSTNSVLPL